MGHLIVGISGYLRSGKDSAGSALVEDGFHHGSFAAKLKDFLLAVNPWVDSELRVRDVVEVYGWEVAKDSYPEVRALLQRVGTDAGRKVLGDDVWVDAAMRDLPEGPAVFTDCRFPNEAAAIRAAGGIVVRIWRPGFEPGPDAHVSETALDGFRFDYTIHNTGTLADLHTAIREVVQHASAPERAKEAIARLEARGQAITPTRETRPPEWVSALIRYAEGTGPLDFQRCPVPARITELLTRAFDAAGEPGE